MPAVVAAEHECITPSGFEGSGVRAKELDQSCKGFFRSLHPFTDGLGRLAWNGGLRSRGGRRSGCRGLFGPECLFETSFKPELVSRLFRPERIFKPLFEPKFVLYRSISDR